MTEGDKLNKYIFSTTLYEYEHGKKPNGRGCWAFSVKGQKNSLFWANFDEAKPLSEMKKKAEKMAEEMGIPHGETLIIEP